MPSYNSEAKDKAFKAWRRCGQNMEETLREMNKLGYAGITRPTLYAWKDEYQWEDRAARADTQERKVNDAELSPDARAVLDLTKQKEKYERYFETLPPNQIDHQATYAYTSLVKTIKDIQSKGSCDKAAVIIEVMGELVDFLVEKDKELAKAFDPYIEKFMARLKTTV
jgi:hypothetical protein